MQFSKYHGLGNDYIVINPKEGCISVELVKLICDRNRGIGSDGILYGPIDEADGFYVKIFNPDGSEAEKSGNGLRIFSRYLWDIGKVTKDLFQIRTICGKVTVEIVDPKEKIKIEMGQVSFQASDIPVLDEQGEVLNKSIKLADEEFTFCAATVGNPHCVIVCDLISPELAKKYGNLIETHKKFPNRTNVQFLKVIDRNNIAIEIWERGAGYTLASGSSSTASAAIAHKLGLCDEKIVVHMPGGTLDLQFDKDFNALMSGPVAFICSGKISQDLLTS